MAGTVGCLYTVIHFILPVISSHFVSEKTDSQSLPTVAMVSDIRTPGLIPELTLFPYLGLNRGTTNVVTLGKLGHMSACISSSVKVVIIIVPSL